MTGGGEMLALAAISFSQVFALGFQSRNVNTGRIGWAAATSFAIGASQALVWRRVTAADAGVLEVLIYATAGAFGIVAAMLAHDRLPGKAG